MIMRIDGQVVNRSNAHRAAAPQRADPPLGPPAPPARPPATAQTVKAKVQHAEKAQARADRAARSVGDSDDVRRHAFVAQQRSDAAQAWREVDAEVDRAYAQGSSGDAPEKNPRSTFLVENIFTRQPLHVASAVVQLDHIEATTAALLDAGSLSPQYQKIVMQSQADAAASVRTALQQSPQPAHTPLTEFARLGTSDLTAPSFGSACSLALQRAQTLEIVGRAAASDRPLETLKALAPQGSGAWTADQIAALQAQVVSGGNADIAAAHLSGGISAATTVLRNQVDAAGSPEEAAAIAARARPLLLQAGIQLGETACAADKADANTPYGVNPRDHFNTTVSNLAAIYEATAPTAANGSRAAQQLILHAVTSNIGGNVRAFDEALARSAMHDGHAALTLDSVAALQRAGKVDQADAILNRSIEAFDTLAEAADAAQGDFDQRRLAAQTYVAKAAPFADAQGIRDALDSFWAQEDNAQSKAEAEAATLAAMQGAAALADMSGGAGASLGHASEAQQRVDNFTTDPATMQAVASHDAVQAFVAQQQFQTGSGRGGFLSPAQLQRAVGRADDPAVARDGWFTLIENIAVGQSVSAKAQGDITGAEAAINSLGRYGPVFAAGDASYDVAIEGLRQAATARDEASVVDALDFWAAEVNSASNLSAADLRISGRFTATGALLLSTVGTGLDLVDLVNNPSWGNAVTLGVDTAQTLSNLAVASAFFEGATPSAGLQTAGRWINGVGAVLATADLLSNPSDNQAVNGLKLLSTVGSWAMLAGGPVGVAGAAVSLLASAAAMQYSRVAASNQYETADAEAFLAESANLGDRQAYHLRNDDSKGRNHNEVIYRAAAQHLGIEADFSAASKAAVVSFLNGLSGDQAGALTDTAARVGFKTVVAGTGADALDGNGQVYAETAANDTDRNRVGTSPRAVTPAPDSVNGLALWIKHTLL